MPSDIDLVIYGGKRSENAYALVRKTLNVPHLEPHVYTLQEVEGVKATVERMDGMVSYCSIGPMIIVC